MAGVKLFENLDVLYAEDLNEYLMSQAVPRFADAATRDAQIPAPTDGQVCYVTGTGLQIYGGAAWGNLFDPDVLAIATLTPANNDLLQRKAGAWVNSTPATVKADLALVKADVGLANADNTTDAAKPVSTATQAALDLKAPLASPAFTGAPTGITKTHVGLGNVDDTADTAKPVSTAQAAADALRVLKAGDTISGSLIIQDDLQVDDDVTLAAGSVITWAVDTNLYRSAANALKTDDAFWVAASQAGVYALTITNANGTGNGLIARAGGAAAVVANFGVVAEAQPRCAILGSGRIEWSTGAIAADTNLFRSAANVLATDDVFRPGVFTTALRPTPAAAGVGGMVYDTTLSRPIWSDGATWRDAAGVAA